MTDKITAKLLAGTLPTGLSSPSYDRNLVKSSIVHIGAGGFHRSHQQRYMDRLLSETGDFSWGICASGIREEDRALKEALKSQDCLYTLVERADDHAEARIIGSMTDYVLGHDDVEAFTQKLAARETKIISLTVTGAGYYIDQRTSGLNLDHPDVRHDLANPSTPKTIFGYLSQALKRRMVNNVPPCTIMSCDNFQGNGSISKHTLLAFCDEVDPKLSKWIDENVAFPNSMVDRITPLPTEETRAFVRERFGLEDQCPVMCEPYIQWVVEDKFSSERPPLEEVGVQFTADVAPYEKIKLRVLNASHSLVAYLGYLAGHRYIFEIVHEPLFAEYLTYFLNEEVTPHLDPVPGVDLADYKRTVVRRFGNPAIKDEALRICMNGSYKFPKFIFPTVRDRLKTGGSIKTAALSVAGWMRFLGQAAEKGSQIPVRDPIADTLILKAKQGGDDAEALLSLREVFGDLSDHDHFRKEVCAYLKQLYAEGAVSTIQACLR
ncbi:MAG: mannitol dehydrogenase family protein [bacterium]|nr:mannitol dehydrogenase family protein [Gammaproteobacteria bacterium]MCP4933184.1 mannitol dehydrogenase family protein [bacterium]